MFVCAVLNIVASHTIIYLNIITMTSKENITPVATGSLVLKHIGMQIAAGGTAGCVEVSLDIITIIYATSF